MIRHEVFHAFVGETNTDSMALDSHDMEELSASIIETHLPEILTLADKILTVGLDRE